VTTGFGLVTPHPFLMKMADPRAIAAIRGSGIRTRSPGSSAACLRHGCRRTSRLRQDQRDAARRQVFRITLSAGAHKPAPNSSRYLNIRVCRHPSRNPWRAPPWAFHSIWFGHCSQCCWCGLMLMACLTRSGHGAFRAADCGVFCLSCPSAAWAENMRRTEANQLAFSNA
jgi:hypothetical protein